MWISSSENILSYTGSKHSFFGKGNLNTPDAIRKIELDNKKFIMERWNNCNRNESRNRSTF